jgi:hypothetical protein
MKMPEMSVESPGEYDDVVVEIDFHPAFTVVIRNEGGDYFIEIFNFDAAQREEYALGRKVARNSVELKEFLRFIKAACKELEYQSPIRCHLA